MGLKERVRDGLRSFLLADTPAPPTDEILFDTSHVFGSLEFGKYNPDVLLTNKGPGVYRRMMHDDQVKSVIMFKIFSITSRKFFFQVDDEEDAAMREMADFFEFALKRINGSFTDSLVGILSALYNGFSITEKVWAPIEWQGRAMWGIDKLKLRPFETFNGGFKVDIHGNIESLEQKSLGNDVTVPLDKVIHFVHQPDKDLHYGESDLRAAYRPWWLKDIALKFQSIHLERHSGGFIWAKITKPLNVNTQTKLESFLQNITAKTTARMPDGVDLNVIHPMKTDAFEKAIAQYNKAIARAVLVPNLLGLSEIGQTGSFAQSQTQLEIFKQVIDAIADRIEEALNEQLFKQLALWNFGTNDFPPFKFEPLRGSELIEMVKAWGELVGKRAVSHTESDESRIREILMMPEKAEPIEDGTPAPGEPEGQDGGDTGLPDANADHMPDEEEPPAPDNSKFVSKKELAHKPWLKRVRFAEMKSALDANDEELNQDVADIMGRISKSLESQIATIFGQKSGTHIKSVEIATIKIPKKDLADLRKTIRAGLTGTLDEQTKVARAELPKRQLAKVIRPGMDETKSERFLSSRAMQITGVLNDRTLSATQNVMQNAIKYDKTLAETIDAMRKDTDLVSMLPRVDSAGRAINIPARIATIVRTNTAEAMNMARQSLFESPELEGFVRSFEYSAVIDDNTSDYCEAMHGRIQIQWGSLGPPAHFNCRSLLVPVTVVDDWDGKESRLPSIRPAKGFE